MPSGAVQLWFSRVLRDGFATAAADSRAFAPFSAVAEHHLYSMLGCVRLDAVLATLPVTSAGSIRCRR